MSPVTRRRVAKVPVGVIHGRFQVLHHDHLRYLLSGKRLCRHLVVGVTNPDPVLSRPEKADPKRGRPEANPLTYFERAALVRAALVEAGVPLEQFTVVPFPVTIPELYRYYVPLDATFFLTVYDDWGRRKLLYFRKLGLRVHVLRSVSPEEKGQSAQDVRDAMAAGRPWRHLVPPSVARLLVRWGLPRRLREGGP